MEQYDTATDEERAREVLEQVKVGQTMCAGLVEQIKQESNRFYLAICEQRRRRRKGMNVNECGIEWHGNVASEARAIQYGIQNKCPYVEDYQADFCQAYQMSYEEAMESVPKFPKRVVSICNDLAYFKDIEDRQEHEPLRREQCTAIIGLGIDVVRGAIAAIANGEPVLDGNGGLLAQQAERFEMLRKSFPTSQRLPSGSRGGRVSTARRENSAGKN
ncbi:hypothetical protein LOZ61_006758 [Ophidiomyces ophidiicola]|uniref:Uncharacterized protein n=1 Tax=Ophidiomyces ophidiicola TaxID=1387563 RepID=A0ACB8USE2_9EURO|nr:hypothetical protein LOZ61_006758 [Ophidiomyces ophidiicola]KAI1911489.1 hypothetical protein LOZ64_004683 [Ophidiomyces ophidiicola]KAI1920337.1 hypothetical protein LOZ60_006597 [Ophidiomyces ophidiicola]KAI1947317.1 hypothetical protein LOZ59_006644 [Ophidiomyces ophidiicola]KAI1963695.1 hypothetical protein LOZ56_006365 [Ophidiomyces ophidiicola]